MKPKSLSLCLRQSAADPYPESNESSPHLPTLRLILILFSHLRLGFPSCLFLPRFPSKILRAFLNIFMRDIFSSPRFDYPNNILWSVQVIKLLIMQFSPASCHFFLLGPNILFSTVFVNTKFYQNSCHNLKVKYAYRRTDTTFPSWTSHKGYITAVANVDWRKLKFHANGPFSQWTDWTS